VDKKYVTMSAPNTPPVVTATELRVQGKARCRRDRVGVLMEEDVARQAALISQSGHEVVAQVVLRVQRVVMDTHSRQVRGEDLNIDRAGGWQTIRAKTRNRIGVGRIPEERVHVR